MNGHQSSITTIISLNNNINIASGSYVRQIYLKIYSNKKKEILNYLISLFLKWRIIQ